MPCDGKNDNCERRRELLTQLKCLITSMDRKKPCEWDEQPCQPPTCAVRQQPQCPPPPCSPCPIPLKPCKSYELRGSIMYRCECIKRNGLQDRCAMWDCMGRPECMTKLYPVCGPGRAALLKLTDLGDLSYALQRFYSADQARESALAAYCRLACPDVNSMIPMQIPPQNCQPPCVYPSFIQLANENEVIEGLHRALVKVRYPGIGDIEPSDLENTILGRDERNKLLHWLLVESLRAIGSTSDEPADDDGSLVKWYVQLGICDDKAALLGQRQIKHQLDTLIRLTRFIMNVLGVGGEKLNIPEGTENILHEYLTTDVNLIPASYKLSNKVSYSEAKRYMKEVSERVKEQPAVTTFVTNTDDVKTGDTNSTEVDGKSFQFDEKAHQLTVEKFCAAFQDINKWTKPTKDNPDESGNWIDNDIENIHGNFTKLKETLDNMIEISNTVIPTELSLREAPLDEIIQDTVIGLEKLQKICDRNDN